MVLQKAKLRPKGYSEVGLGDFRIDCFGNIYLALFDLEEEIVDEKG